MRIQFNPGFCRGSKTHATTILNLLDAMLPPLWILIFEVAFSICSLPVRFHAMNFGASNKSVALMNIGIRSEIVAGLDTRSQYIICLFFCDYHLSSHDIL